jgi:hypothetical protein
MINSKQIKLLESYRDKSYVLSLLCIECSDFYGLIRNVLNVPLILSNSVMLILNSYDKINKDHLQISNIVLNASTALILSLTNSFKINDKVANFKTIGQKLSIYCSNIEDILSDDMTDINHDTIKKLIDDYNNLNEMIEYPFVSYIKKKVKKKYDGKKTLPNALNCTSSFVILEEKNNIV